MLQIWSLHALLWQLAGTLRRVPAARFACLSAAACPYSWSVLIGQETGLTALSVLGIMLGLHEWNVSRSSQWAAFIGIFAAVGASAREYRPRVSNAGGCRPVVVRADRRAWIMFSPRCHQHRLARSNRGC
jgi:hypothetical protein